jgi:hypothetical protein
MIPTPPNHPPKKPSPPMKTPLLVISSLAGIAMAAPPMTDRITPEEIAARRKPSPITALGQPVAVAEAQVVRPGGQSLIKQSDILSDGHNWTLVPKGAVLHIPAELANRVAARPIGTLLTWTDFLTVNRGWLFTEEVTFPQAAGKAPIPASRSEFWQKNGKVIVAVHLGGPISVRIQPSSPVASTR